MAFRTKLTVTGPDMGDDDLKLAADLCDEIGAHLAVLAVVIAAPPPVGAMFALSRIKSYWGNHARRASRTGGSNERRSLKKSRIVSLE